MARRNSERQEQADLFPVLLANAQRALPPKRAGRPTQPRGPQPMLKLPKRGAK